MPAPYKFGSTYDCSCRVQPACNIILRAFKTVGGFFPNNWVRDTRSGITDGDIIGGTEAGQGHGMAAVTELKTVYLAATKIITVRALDYNGDLFCTGGGGSKLIRYKFVWRFSQNTGQIKEYIAYTDSPGFFAEFAHYTWSEIDGSLTVLQAPSTTSWQCSNCLDLIFNASWQTCTGYGDASYYFYGSSGGCPDFDGQPGDPDLCSFCGTTEIAGVYDPDGGTQVAAYTWEEAHSLYEVHGSLGTLLYSEDMTYSDGYAISTALNDVSSLTTRFCSLPLAGSNGLPEGARFTTAASLQDPFIGCDSADCTSLVVTPIQGGAVLADGIAYDVLAGMAMEDLGGGAHTHDSEFDPTGGATNAAYWPSGFSGYTGDGLIPAFCAVINISAWDDGANPAPCTPTGLLISVIVAAQQSQLKIDANWLTANSADNFCIKQTFFSWDKPVNTGCADVCCQYYYYATATDQIGRDPTIDGCTPDHTIGSETCVTAASNNYGVWLFSTSGILAPGATSNVGSDLRPGSPDPPHNAGGVTYIKFGTIGTPCCP